VRFYVLATEECCVCVGLSNNFYSTTPRNILQCVRVFFFVGVAEKYCDPQKPEERLW